ncbi:MAG: hypothetical protein L6R48_21850 [Planctomycetes bacterium]|nr:hypothetical protein [Planctomycetota bacterium]
MTTPPDNQQTAAGGADEDEDAIALAARVTERLRESQRLRTPTLKAGPNPPTTATRRITPVPG